MARKRIKRILQDPESYGDVKKQFPRVAIRPNSTRTVIIGEKKIFVLENKKNREENKKKF